MSQIIADAQENDPVACLGNAVMLRLDDRSFNTAVIEAPAIDQRINRIATTLS